MAMDSNASVRYFGIVYRLDDGREIVAHSRNSSLDEAIEEGHDELRQLGVMHLHDGALSFELSSEEYAESLTKDVTKESSAFGDVRSLLTGDSAHRGEEMAGQGDPKQTKRIRMLLSSDLGMHVVQLMSRQDLKGKDERGSFYIDDFTDYVADLHEFMQSTKGKGKVLMTLGFVDEERLKEIAAELVERRKHKTLTMADLTELMKEE